MKHIVFLDVDGTIYSRDRIIHPQTIKDINHAQKNGVEIVINTGNGPFTNMKKLCEKLNIRYLINSNGASIFDVKENKEIYSKVIPKEAVNEMIKAANELKLAADWWDDKEIYINKYAPRTTIEIIKHAMSDDKEPTPVDHVVNDVYKFEFYGDNASFEPVIDKLLSTIDQTTWNFARMKSHHVEVTQKGVSKGDGVKHFCELFGVDLKNTAAVGDSPNDHSMFEVVGHSYAMDNADSLTKTKVTHYTSDVKQNGVGEAIIDFMFRMGIDK